MHVMLVIAWLAVKGEKDQPEHVERSEQCGEQPKHIEQMVAAAILKRIEQDSVLAEEAGKRRNARNGQRRDEHCPVRVLDFLTQAAHLAHVLLAAHGMDDAARREEEERLKECVSHQMEDARGERAHAASQEHV